MGNLWRVTDVSYAVNACQLCSSAPNTRCNHCSGRSLFIPSRLFFCSFQCIVLEGKLALKTNPKPPCLSTAGDCYWPQLLLLRLITSIWACSIPLPVTPTCNTYTFLSAKNNILKSIRLPHRLPISPYYNYSESITSEANYALFCPIFFFPNGQ